MHTLLRKLVWDGHWHLLHQLPFSNRILDIEDGPLFRKLPLAVQDLGYSTVGNVTHRRARTFRQCMGSYHNDVNVVSNRLPIPYRPEKLLYPVFSHRQIFL